MEWDWNFVWQIMPTLIQGVKITILATLLGFPLNEAASIGVIGAIDGPTSIYVAQKLAPELLARQPFVNIAVTEYQYFFTFFPGLEHPVYRVFHVFEEEGIMKVAEIVLKKVENVGAVNNVPSGKN